MQMTSVVSLEIQRVQDWVRDRANQVSRRLIWNQNMQMSSMKTEIVFLL